MQKTTLIAHTRDVFGKKLSAQRKSGNLPAIVYGQEKDNEPIFLNAHEFGRIYSTAGHNTILDLKIDQDKSANVLIQEVEQHAVTGELMHADLYRVNMSQTIKTTVPLSFVGDSPAVYQQEGTLLTNIEEVEVETLPAKLPASIEVDISVLDDFEKSIHISDLVVPEGVEILVDSEELIAKVEAPRSQEEIDALDEDIVEEIPDEDAEGGEGSEGESTEEATSESDNKSSSSDNDKDSAKKD